MRRAVLALVQPERRDRVSRDRLELLTALIESPSFDPLYRSDVIKVPGHHPVYSWQCVVAGCEQARNGGVELCNIHNRQWAQARENGVGKAEFVRTVEPLVAAERMDEEACRICPQRPAAHIELRLCRRHETRWYNEQRSAADTDFDRWLADQEQLDGYGHCLVTVCPHLAASPLRLCSGHESRYHRHGRPGGAALPDSWWHRFEQHGRPVPVGCTNESLFRRWCGETTPMPWPGQLNLIGLPRLLGAEIRWSLHAHAARARRTRWDLGWVRTLVNTCRAEGVTSIVDLDLAGCTHFAALVAREMLKELRLVYYTPADAREAGFLETDHFGVRMPDRASHIDLTAVSQRWLRDLLWDYLATLLRSPRCPRSSGPIDGMRRAATELSAFLELDAPGGGHDPSQLQAEHAHRFVADQRHRERDGMDSLVMMGSDGAASTVTTSTRTIVFNGTRKLLRDALESGAADRIGLRREFITAIPTAGGSPLRARRPFPDDVARALADETNLARLAEVYDPHDQGLRDAWEAIVVTGRRVSEILRLRLDCLGRYGQLPMLWHDQTKVGNYDAAIRIPERLHQLLASRQAKTLTCIEARYGQRPTAAQRAAIALFPARYRNPDGTTSLSYQWFHKSFRQWLDQLDLGDIVPHQARHTLATNLLRHGASLTHVRRYLGHISDRMAEHYVHLSHSDLEEVLHQVWVAGPGAVNPGELLSSPITPMTREQSQTLAIDLSRRFTPAEGGFCTFQPVVDGGACPWKLDCHNCDKFVLSGADLLYWRRKREQWTTLAERAPDDATAAYLHHVFEPTARAIDGLEKALAGLGLLDEALAMDLRRPPRLLPPRLEHRVPGCRPGRHTSRRNRRMNASPRTAAANQARHNRTLTSLTRFHDAIARMRRERLPVTAVAVARRANVSRTFLYTNRDARSQLNAARQADAPLPGDLDTSDDMRESTWRERALNAEETLKTALAEILNQRGRIGELMGHIRDLQAEWTHDAIQRVTTENTTLKQRARQLTQDNRVLDERLAAARSTLRFQDRRLADLEAQLADPATR
jgi:integrase